MPDAMTGVTGSAPTSAPPAAAGDNPLGRMDKDMFLKLMVAQLKYQNPMSPSDPSQFMAQTAQFTMVEKLDAISQSQTELGAWQRSLVGTQLLGHQVSGTGPTGAVVQGLVTGLTLGSAGAQLQLAGGGTLPVESVTSVTIPPTGPSTASPAASPTASPTGSPAASPTGSPAASTPTATPASTPPATQDTGGPVT